MKRQRIRIGILSILCLASTIYVSGQDPQYAQFYAAPLYVSPAFAGLTNQHRIVMNVRDQWPGLPNEYNSFSMSYDRNVPDLNSGFGVIANGELAGSGQLWKIEVAPVYSYQVLISEKYILRPAIKVGFTNIGVNRNKLVFNDQLNSGQESVENRVRSGRFYLDFSGGLLFATEGYWGGISVNHMNTPDQSLLENTPKSPLPVKVSIHGGAKIPIKVMNRTKSADRDLTVATQYKSQGKFDQWDLGLYYNHNPLVLGVWYRGVPIKKNAAESNNSAAFTFLIGFKKMDVYSLGFSYDLDIARYNFTRSAGAFEISFIREWSVKKKKRRRSFIVPCPKF